LVGLISSHREAARTLAIGADANGKETKGKEKKMLSAVLVVWTTG